MVKVWHYMFFEVLGSAMKKIRYIAVLIIKNCSIRVFGIQKLYDIKKENCWVSLYCINIQKKDDFVSFIL